MQKSLAVTNLKTALAAVCLEMRQRSPEWLEPTHLSVAYGAMRSVALWRQLVTTFFEGDLSDADKDRKEALERFKHVNGADPEQQSIVVASGVQAMVLAFVRGAAAFQGISFHSALLPESVADSVVRSIYVPFDRGRVWMWARLIHGDGPDDARARVLRDASIDRNGRVASQDYVLGNRSVVGFPLFVTKVDWRQDDALGISGFVFVTHPAPSALGDVSPGDEDGVAPEVLTSILKENAPYLALCCQDWALEQVSARTLTRFSGRAMELSHADIAGHRVAIFRSELPRNCLTGIDEKELARDIWSRLTNPTDKPWSRVVQYAQALSRITNDRTATFFIRAGAQETDDSLASPLRDCGELAYGAAPILQPAWAEACRLSPVGEAPLCHTMTLVYNPAAAQVDELVVPICHQAGAIGMLWLNVTRSSASLRSISELYKATCAQRTRLDSCFGLIVDTLQEAYESVENLGGADRRQVAKRIQDFWYLAGQWLVDEVANALAIHPSGRAADSSAIHTLATMLTSLAPPQSQGTILDAYIRAFSELRTGLLSALGGEEEEPAPVAIVSLWGRSWDYAGESGATHWTEFQTLPIAYAAVPGRLVERISEHLVPLQLPSDPGQTIEGGPFDFEELQASLDPAALHVAQTLKQVFSAGPRTPLAWYRCPMQDSDGTLYVLGPRLPADARFAAIHTLSLTHIEYQIANRVLTGNIGRSIGVEELWNQVEQLASGRGPHWKHRVIDGANGIPPAEQHQIRNLLRFFLDVEEQDWQLFFTDEDGRLTANAAEGYKSLLGLDRGITALGAWLLALSAHQRHSRVPWKSVFSPKEFRDAKKGHFKFNITAQLADGDHALAIRKAFQEMCVELIEPLGDDEDKRKPPPQDRKQLLQGVHLGQSDDNGRSFELITLFHGADLEDLRSALAHSLAQLPRGLPGNNKGRTTTGSIRDFLCLSLLPGKTGHLLGDPDVASMAIMCERECTTFRWRVVFETRQRLAGPGWLQRSPARANTGAGAGG